VTTGRSQAGDTRAGPAGVLLPQANTTAQAEIGGLVSGSTPYRYQRFGTLAHGEADLTACRQDILAAAERFAPTELAVLGVAYTTASIIGGAEWDQNLRDSLAAAGGHPVVTAASALVESLRVRQVQAIAVVSPYPESVNRRLPGFFADSGIETVTVASGPLGRRPSSLSEAEVLDLALSAERTGAQALVLCCTALRTAAVVAEIELATDLPVVTGNAALASALARQIRGTGAPS
jgi:maleate isomerase